MTCVKFSARAFLRFMMLYFFVMLYFFMTFWWHCGTRRCVSRTNMRSWFVGRTDMNGWCWSGGRSRGRSWCEGGWDWRVSWCEGGWNWRVGGRNWREGW